MSFSVQASIVEISRDILQQETEECGCHLEVDGKHVRYEQKWENERKMLLQGWIKPKLPMDPANWSDETGNIEKFKINLPENWTWSTEWGIFKDHEDGQDEDGWMYAHEFFTNYHCERGNLDFARRRKWIRTRIYHGPPGECRETNERNVSFDGLVYSGWLRKKGEHSIDRFKTRFFELRSDRTLYYYSQKPDEKHEIQSKGAIVMNTVSKVETVTTRGNTFGINLRTPHRTYILSASNEDDQINWVTILQNILHEIEDMRKQSFPQKELEDDAPDPRNIAKLSEDEISIFKRYGYKSEENSQPQSSSSHDKKPRPPPPPTPPPKKSVPETSTQEKVPHVAQQSSKDKPVPERRWRIGVVKKTSGKAETKPKQELEENKQGSDIQSRPESKSKPKDKSESEVKPKLKIKAVSEVKPESEVKTPETKSEVKKDDFSSYKAVLSEKALQEIERTKQQRRLISQNKQRRDKERTKRKRAERKARLEVSRREQEEMDNLERLRKEEITSKQTNASSLEHHTSNKTKKLKAEVIHDPEFDTSAVLSRRRSNSVQKRPSRKRRNRKQSQKDLSRQRQKQKKRQCPCPDWCLELLPDTVSRNCVIL